MADDNYRAVNHGPISKLGHAAGEGARRSLGWGALGWMVGAPIALAFLAAGIGLAGLAAIGAAIALEGTTATLSLGFIGEGINWVANLFGYAPEVSTAVSAGTVGLQTAGAVGAGLLTAGITIPAAATLASGTLLTTTVAGTGIGFYRGAQAASRQTSKEKDAYLFEASKAGRKAELNAMLMASMQPQMPEPQLPPMMPPQDMGMGTQSAYMGQPQQPDAIRTTWVTPTPPDIKEPDIKEPDIKEPNIGKSSPMASSNVNELRAAQSEIKVKEAPKPQPRADVPMHQIAANTAQHSRMMPEMAMAKA